MYHYLYKITNNINKRVYIGAHSTENLDDGYMGSGLALKKAIKKYGKESFSKEILEFFDSLESLYEKEKEIVTEEVAKSRKYYNMVVGGVGCSRGKILTKDKDGRTFHVSTTDQRYLNGELVPFLKNTVQIVNEEGEKRRINSFELLPEGYKYLSTGYVTVYDDSGKSFRVSKEHPEYLNGNLSFVTKGRVPVRDRDGNTFQVAKNDPRYLSGELISVMKGLVSVRDKEGNTLKVSINDPRYLSGELVYIRTGHSPPPLSEEKRIERAEYTREKNLNSTCISNPLTKERKRVMKENLEEFLAHGWILGWGSKRKIKRRI